MGDKKWEESGGEAYYRWIMEGDVAFFEKFVGYYEYFVYSTACRALAEGGGPISEGEDVAQETFLKIWRKGTTYRGKCALAGWIYRVTVNTARDHLRKSRRGETEPLIRRDGEGEDTVWEVPVISEETLPEEAILQKERVLMLRQALNSLPADARRVIVLRDLHGFTYAEIGELLDLPEGTVKSKLNRGRAAIRKILSEKDCGMFF